MSINPANPSLIPIVFTAEKGKSPIDFDKEQRAMNWWLTPSVALGRASKIQISKGQICCGFSTLQKTASLAKRIFLHIFLFLPAIIGETASRGLEKKSVSYKSMLRELDAFRLISNYEEAKAVTLEQTQEVIKLLKERCKGSEEMSKVCFLFAFGLYIYPPRMLEFIKGLPKDCTIRYEYCFTLLSAASLNMTLAQMKKERVRFATGANEADLNGPATPLSEKEKNLQQEAVESFKNLFSLERSPPPCYKDKESVNFSEIERSLLNNFFPLLIDRLLYDKEETSRAQALDLLEKLTLDEYLLSQLDRKILLTTYTKMILTAKDEPSKNPLVLRAIYLAGDDQNLLKGLADQLASIEEFLSFFSVFDKLLTIWQLEKAINLFSVPVPNPEKGQSDELRDFFRTFVPPTVTAEKLKMMRKALQSEFVPFLPVERASLNKIIDDMILLASPSESNAQEINSIGNRANAVIPEENVAEASAQVSDGTDAEGITAPEERQQQTSYFFRVTNFFSPLVRTAARALTNSSPFEDFGRHIDSDSSEDDEIVSEHGVELPVAPTPSTTGTSNSLTVLEPGLVQGPTSTTILAPTPVSPAVLTPVVGGNRDRILPVNNMDDSDPHTPIHSDDENESDRAPTEGYDGDSSEYEDLGYDGR